MNWDHQVRTAVQGTGVWQVELAEAGRCESLEAEQIDLLKARPGIVLVQTEIRATWTELALAADLVLADESARLVGDPDAPPDRFETAFSLRQRLGAGGALNFWLDADGWPAERARARGLVDRLGDHSTIQATAERWHRLWSERGHALALLRELDAGRVAQRAALQRERALFALAFASDSARDGARGFFDPPR